MATIFSNPIDFQNAVANAQPGAKLELKPGVYDGDIKLDYRKSAKITVYMHGVELHSPGDEGLYTLDITGENIDVLADEIKLSGGKTGVLGIRGHYLKIISDLKGYVTGNNLGGDLFGTNNHVQGLNFDSLGNVGMSAKGFPLNENRTYAQKFGWYPSHNWRITQCIFQNIQPREPGDAGGGLRIIPHAKDVTVDNCLFRKIKGSGLWGDHNQKGFEWYWNIFEDIESDPYGKALFLEIMDPDPADKSGFVAKIAGNIFRRCDSQTILVAASSGQNPAGIDVFGNIIEDGWGLVAGAMPREFKRRWSGKYDQSDWEVIEARLENIRFRKNVIRQTTGRNHISVFQGKNSGLIEVDGNYYVTGHSYSWSRPNGVIETNEVTEPQIYVSDPTADSLFIHGKSNAPDLDKNAVVGPMPEEFPFPEVWEEIPVDKVENIFDIVDNPNSGGGIDPPPPVSDELPHVWLFSDNNDPDDQGALSVDMLGAKDNFIIKGITVGCQPNTMTDPEYSDPLEKLKERHVKAWIAERGNLDCDYDFQVKRAMTYTKNFNNYDGSPVDYIDLTNYSPEFPLYLCSGAPNTEVAKILEDMEMRGINLKKVVIVSHFTQNPEDNNYKRDKAAMEYLKGLASSGDLFFIELDRFGADLWDKNAAKGELSPEVLKSKIGQYIGDKWIENSLSEPGRPDASDSVRTLIFNKQLFGDFLQRAKRDGTSNLSLLHEISPGKQAVYSFVEERAALARGEGDNNTDPNQSSELLKKVDNLILKQDKLLSDLADLLYEAQNQRANLEALKYALN